MNQLFKLSLSILGITTILAFSYTAVAERRATEEGKKGFGMEISVPGRPPFTLSVRAKDERLGVVPVSGENAYAIKVIPAVAGDSLRFRLLAVLDKLPETLSCDNIKKLKTEPGAIYVAHEGDVIRVSEFEKFGVAPFTVKVMSLAAVQTVCPDGACCCGGNTCYPNPGHCIECGGCGSCCKSAGGEELMQ
jgi:hypothetical protein